MPSPRGSSWPRDLTYTCCVSYIAGGVLRLSQWRSSPWGKLMNQMVKKKEQTFLFVVVSKTLWLSKLQLSPWLTSTWICGSEKDGFFLFLIISIIPWSLKKAPSTNWKVVSSCFGGMNGFMIMASVLFKVYYSGLPAVKNPPASARNMGSIPGEGTKMPHASSTEPQHQSKRSPMTQQHSVCHN